MRTDPAVSLPMPDGDAGAAARGARNARAVVGVARGAEARVVVGDADGEFMQVGLA
jgi:hypothetical protein